jgi:hypothetical protein
MSLKFNFCRVNHLILEDFSVHLFNRETAARSIHLTRNRMAVVSSPDQMVMATTIRLFRAVRNPKLGVVILAIFDDGCLLSAVDKLILFSLRYPQSLF